MQTIARPTWRRQPWCGYVDLALGRVARIRRKLRRLVWASGLSYREFAAAIGVDPGTIENHLGGRRPSECRAVWYDHVESVCADDEHIVITLRRGARGRKVCGWRRPIESYQDD